MAVGIREMTELEIASSSADAIKWFSRLIDAGVPVVTPPGGLACHLDAMRFIPQFRRLSTCRALPRRLSSSPESAHGARNHLDGSRRSGQRCASDIELLRLACRAGLHMSHFITPPTACNGS